MVMSIYTFSMSGVLFPNGVCSVFMNLDEEMKSIAQTGVRMYFAVRK